jgi:hypothetical protein
MADFFKYVGKADRGIQDWSKIGKDISDGLKEVTDKRQAERARIDKLTSDAINEVNNVELGQNKTFNQFLLNGSGQTKEFLLMQEKLLKQGVLKPQDYLNSRQIVSDDWANLSEAAKSFNTDYAESMSRLQDGKAAMQELYQNEKYDAFMNVQDKDVFINPVDGRMYLTTTDGDGNIERDPASMLNVNSINARRKDKINKFNVQAEVQKATGALGEVVKALNADGVITRTDKRLNEMMLIGGVETTFDDAKNDIIDSLMTSPRNNASILTDDVGGYTFTEVESKAGGKVIYLKENGMGLLEPQLTDEQLGVVRNNLDMEIEKQLGFKETSSYEADLRKRTADADRAERRAARLAKEEDFSDVYSYAVDLASGDSTGVRRVVQSLKQTHPHLSFTPSEGDTPGWDVYNSKTGVEDTIEIVDGDVAGFSDALFNVIVGDQGVKGIQITSKAKDQYLKGNTLPTDVVKATSGSTRKKLSVISGGGIPSTGVEDDKGKPITISDAINEKGEKKGYKLKTRSDFEKAVHTMQLPAEYKAIQNKIPKEFRFREVDGEMMMYYPGPGEERYQANLGEDDIRNDMLKYINEGLKNLIQNENARIDKINDRAMGKKSSKKTLPQLKKENPNMSLPELTALFKNQ